MPDISDTWAFLIISNLRDNARQHQALVNAVSKLSDTIVGLEQRLEERVETHSRRFERYALAQERRMTELETRCAFEHGDLPDRRQPRQFLQRLKAHR